ncbi:hypothetical protein D3C80_2022110 [compost metagenome]
MRCRGRGLGLRSAVGRCVVVDVVLANAAIEIFAFNTHSVADDALCFRQYGYDFASSMGLDTAACAGFEDDCIAAAIGKFLHENLPCL